MSLVPILIPAAPLPVPLSPILISTPSSRFLVALAVSHSNDFRRLVQSKEYKRLFPNTCIDPTKNTESEVRTTKRGFRLRSPGVAGPIKFLLNEPYSAAALEDVSEPLCFGR